ncbi:kinetochore complex Sim4 subunit Fta2 [Apiospora sp. TS-2023a]
MDEGVPPVPGPKLYPFKDGDGPLKIEWLRHIERGTHARIWAVLINGKLYALKIFNFRKRYFIREEWDVKLSKEEETAYFDPFSCECRAYGRIREEGLEQYVAKCYGYIKLARSDFDPLIESPRKWEARFGYLERHKGRPFRALVKEFVKTDPDRYPPLPNKHGLENVRRANKCFRDSKDARHLIRSLKRIQKSGILIHDINAGNVMNGRLIDFSQAWTVPHPVLVKEKMEDDEIMEIYDGGYSDACDVDKLIETWNNQHLDRNRADRLKGNFGTQWRWGRTTCGWYIRPELYKWHAEGVPVEQGKG